MVTLSLEQQIGQMVMAQAFGRFRSATTAEFRALRSLVTDSGIGGFKLYHGYALGTLLLVSHLQRAATSPLFIAADLEQGLGQQVADAPRFPPLAALGAIGDPDLAYRAGVAVASEALQLGINTLFGPLLDLHHAQDAYFGSRSLGSRPEAVAELGMAWARGVREAGALPVVKYFPGHGRQHLLPDGSSVVDASGDVLAQSDWRPFCKTIQAGLPAIMVSHGAYPWLDATGWPSAAGTVPAALSPVIVDGWLRQRLGFEGLIVSDALNLPFLRRAFTARQIARQAAAAGVDLLVALSHPEDAKEAMAGIGDALAAGEIDPAGIARAADRILNLKIGLGRSPILYTGDDPPAKSLGSDETLALIEEIAARSICLLKCPDEGFPLRQRPLTLPAIVVGSAEQRDRIRRDRYRPWHATALPEGVELNVTEFSPGVSLERLNPLPSGAPVLLMPLATDAAEGLASLARELWERDIQPILLLPLAPNAARRLAHLGWASIWLADADEACRAAALDLVFGGEASRRSQPRLTHREV